MIPEDEKDYIIEVLSNWLGPVDKPRQTLTAPFSETTFPQILRQGNPRELVIDAVRLCLADGWNNDPPWLSLLFSVFPVDILDAKLAEISERIKHKPAVAANPLDSTVLNNATPFVNRTSLRSFLRVLATQSANAKPILVVNGASKSGKSYSTNYIEHFSNNQQSIITYRLVFDSDVGLETGAGEVAVDLVSKMGRTLEYIKEYMPKPDTNQKLFVRGLARWVLNEATQTPSQHWFILDNFHGEKLRPDTRDFLVALSDNITTGIFTQRCRLILIGFDRATLTVEPGKVEEERVAPCSAAEVKICISDILKRIPLQLTAVRVEKYVLDSLPAGAGKMSELNLRLRVVIRATEEIRRILGSVVGADFETILFKIIEDLPQTDARMQELQQRLESLGESVAEI